MITYYLSAASAIANLFTNSPIVKAIPTLLTTIAAFAPKLLPIGLTKRYSVEDRRKLNQLKVILLEVATNLNVDKPEKIALRVTRQFRMNAGMIGNATSFGGPLMCLGNEYFNNYGVADDQYAFCLKLLNEIPNSPIALGKYLDECPPEKKGRIFEYAKMLKSRLSKNEMQYIFAREIGHAKQHHMLRTLGLISLIIVAHQVAIVFSLVLSIELALVYILASLPLTLISIFKINRIQEKEADLESIALKEYQKGFIDFQKKTLILYLSNTKGSAEAKVSKMIKSWEWFSVNPNPAKRLLHAVNLSNMEEKPVQAMSKTAWIVALIGIGHILNRCFSNAANILSFYQMNNSFIDTFKGI
jgi:Zn-dependent protease with chaperone function